MIQPQPIGTVPPRPGPRPLPLHLVTAVATWTGSLSVLPLLRSGSLPWKPPLVQEADALRRALDGVAPEAFSLAVATEAQRRFDALIAAIAAYRRHPARRAMPEPPTIWREGSTRLLDYGTDAADGAVPVLVVPSLINRYHVLDLSPERSFVRHLATRGIRPLVVDWDAPGEVERSFGLSDYIAGRLENALDAAIRTAGRPVAVLGYCMGGVLALALAVRRQADIMALALLATPWDFHAERAGHARLAAAGLGPLAPVLEATGELPVDVIQTLFYAVDPYQVIRKFLAFGRLDPASPRAAAFVFLEDWLNDGVPLAAPVARECLDGWYGENRTGRGLWRIGGQLVEPAKLGRPTLVVVPARDRIVPPASAAALAAAIPGAERRTPTTGHIGMVAGEAANARIAEPLAAWLRDKAGGTRL